jgi:hypothetical protein
MKSLPGKLVSFLLNIFNDLFALIPRHFFAVLAIYTEGRQKAMYKFNDTILHKIRHIQTVVYRTAENDTNRSRLHRRHCPVPRQIKVFYQSDAIAHAWDDVPWQFL